MDGCFGGLRDGRGEESGLSPTETNMLGSTGYGRRAERTGYFDQNRLWVLAACLNAGGRSVLGISVVAACPSAWSVLRILLGVHQQKVGW